MIAIGCLAPIILMVIGGLVGNVVGGADTALWGAGGGFVVGLLILAVFGWLAEKLKQ